MWRRPAAGAWRGARGALMTRRATAAASAGVSQILAASGVALLASGSESIVTHPHDHRRHIPLTQLFLHPTAAIYARAYISIRRPIPPKGAPELDEAEEERDSMGSDATDEDGDGDEESEEWEAYSFDFGALDRIDEEDGNEDEGSGGAGTSK